MVRSRSIRSVLAIGLESMFLQHLTRLVKIIHIRTNQEESNRPDLGCYRKALFWDTTIESLDWDKNKEWIVRRVFEYGSEEEILETIRFYGKESVGQILIGITDERKAQNRNENLQKYLN